MLSLCVLRANDNLEAPDKHIGVHITHETENVSHNGASMKTVLNL